ncbi:MAG: PLP-dependent transferase, partial [Alphaproteobacteria bacterium]
LKRRGIEVRFADPADPENFRRATNHKTRAYHGETLANPKLTVFPIGEVAGIGRALGIPLIIDNTATPILCRPFDHGAAVIVYAASKYIGGLIVDAGNFEWRAHPERQPVLNRLNPGHHGTVWTAAIKARATLSQNREPAVSPFDALRTLQGLETLTLRIREHCRNAEAVTDYLNRHEQVARLIHPSLQGGEDRARADKYLRGGHGGLVGLELRGGLAAGQAFVKSLGLFRHAVDIGDARSLAIHPATTTHSQLSVAKQLAMGIGGGYVRLSVGLEHIDDIIADLAQALDQAAEKGDSLLNSTLPPPCSPLGRELSKLSPLPALSGLLGH